MEPIVSVIIPTYNRPTFLRRAIQSALNQTEKNLEIIVVNDGGTDKIRQVTSSFGSNKIVYQYKKNGGTPSARNVGFRLAKGQWIALLDDDDEWLPQKTKKQLDAGLHIKDSLIYTNGYRIDQHKLIDTFFYRPSIRSGLDLLNKNIIPASSVMFPKSFIDRLGYFNESIPGCDDFEYWLRCSMICSFIGIQEPLFRYYIHETNEFHHQEQLAEKINGISENFLSKIKSKAIYSTIDINKAESSILFKKGKLHFFKNQRFFSIKYISLSIVKSPKNFRAWFFLLLTPFGRSFIRRLVPLYQKIFQKHYFEFG